MIFSENEKAANAAFYHVKPVSVMFYRMIVLNIFILRLKRRRTTTKNTGTKKMARTVAVTIPPITPVPTAFCAPEPAPELITSGITPRINAGTSSGLTQTHTNGFQRGFNQAFSFFLHQIFGEFDDEYRVLRRQANGCQQAHGSKRRWSAHGRLRQAVHR